MFFLQIFGHLGKYTVHCSVLKLVTDHYRDLEL